MHNQVYINFIYEVKQLLSSKTIKNNLIWHADISIVENFSLFLHQCFNQVHNSTAPWFYILEFSLFLLEQVSVAGYTAGQRAKHVPRGKYVAGMSILAGTAITMLLLVILRVFPFTPRYIIPVAGMMVGNAMTVTGVTMKKLRDDIKMQMNLVWDFLINRTF